MKRVLPPLHIDKKKRDESLNEQTAFSESWYRQQSDQQNSLSQNSSFDKTAFLKYYENLVKNDPGPGAYIMLGDAYMKVKKLDKAVACYERAVEVNSKNVFLLCTVGDKLVKTHNFFIALKLYQNYVKDTNNFNLKLQLAELYLKLAQYDKSELTLLELLEENNESDSTAYLKGNVKILYLLSEAQKRAGNLFYSSKYLKDAIDIQKKLLEIDEQCIETDFLVEMIIKRGELLALDNKMEEAISFHKDALIFSPKSVKILLSLANLHLRRNDLDSSEQICFHLTNIERDNEETPIITIDIAIGRTDFESANYLCRQILTKHPNNWKILVRIVDTYRRLGELEKSLEYIKNAYSCCNHHSDMRKIHFCKALYEWYAGNSNLSVGMFNFVQNDPDIGIQALYHTIEISLDVDDICAENKDTDDTKQEALKTADDILEKLQSKLGFTAPNTVKYRILINLRLILTKEKVKIQNALDDLTSFGQQQKLSHDPGIIFGTSTALMFLRQETRAKNQLKLIANSNWTFENSEYLERCWLMLANLYIRAGELEIATQLIHKVLKYNKSSVKAHEHLGFISETKKNYKDASVYYEWIWKSTKKANLVAGFKLTCCYMKAKYYSNAIMTIKDISKSAYGCNIIVDKLLDESIGNLRI